VNDPTTAASNLFTAQEVKNAINDSYQMLMDEARLQEVGYGRKRTYTTSVADQLYYQLPSDCMKVVSIEVDVDGNDLSATGSNSNFLKPIAADIGFEGYEKGLYDNTEFYFIHSNDYFAVISPPSTGGSNSIRLNYEAHSTALSADADEPVIRDPYHYLICLDAAIILKASIDLILPPDLMNRRNRMYARFMESVSENIEDNEGQIYVAGLTLGRDSTVTGFTRRGRRVDDRSRWPQ
jgi:hypothetical protein